MKRFFNARTRKFLFWSVVVFVALFTFRIIYGYTLPVNQPNHGFLNEVKFESSMRNYATKKYKASQNSNPKSVSQKYEKIADIKSTSVNYSEEEKELRKKIKKQKALIQFEQKRGNKGERVLNLAIGVPPENFEILYAELSKIGKVVSKQITKKDKTNEYKELKSKKQSLEKIWASLEELKYKPGKIEEFMHLENRILQINQQLLALGVSLGDFDDENEFCTIKFSLSETKVKTISIFHRIKVALQWTVKIYLKLSLIAFLVVGFSYLSLKVYTQLKSFQSTGK